MKRYIILILTLFVLQAGSTVVQAQLIGDTWENPIDAGSYSSNFNYNDKKNTIEFTNTHWWYTKDVYYKFTITQRMKIRVSLCLSAMSRSYLTLLNYQGFRIAYNDGSDEGCWPGSKQACITMELPAGTYYAVCEGYYDDGNILTNINGTLLTPAPTGDKMSDPLLVGTYGDSFRYSNTQNTADGFTNQYNGRSTNDVFYKFTTTQKMDITISLCNSELNDTYLWLLDSNGNLVSSNNDYCGSKSTLSMPGLASGTYYVVCEGNTQNGKITIDITGKGQTPLFRTGDSMSDPIIVGTFSNSFNYSDGQNTAAFGFTDQYGQPTNDVFYKFTVTQKMDIAISTCPSGLYMTHVWLLDSNGNQIAYNNNNANCGSRGMLSVSGLGAGTYYVVSEGSVQNGSVITEIKGTLQVQPTPAGDSRSNPIDAGTYSSGFVFKDVKNTSEGFTSQYPGLSTNDVFYKFTLTKMMHIDLFLCNSSLTDTYVYLLDSNGNLIDSNDDNSHCGPYSKKSYLMKTFIPAGTYYVVSKGKDQNGSIETWIEGKLPPEEIKGDKFTDPFIIGTFSQDFSNAYLINTVGYTNQYNGRPTNDVFYKFTINCTMDISLSLCGSQVSDTYLWLLNSSGSEIASNSKSDQCGAGSGKSYLSKQLPAGTYYIVTEGYSTNGEIGMHITGTVPLPPPPTGDKLSDPILIGTKSGDFSYTDSQNTATGFTNQYSGQSTADVFYKFTTTTAMDVVLSLCGSRLIGTYLYLLDSSGKQLASSGASRDCPGGQSYLKMPQLAAGTYYIVYEGTATNGVITLLVNGTVPAPAPTPVITPSASQNYIRSYSPTTPVTTAAALTADNSRQGIQYFDGLGRPVQTVQAGITPAKKDLVSFVRYDGSGRDSVSWLPGAITSGQSGSFRAINATLEAEIRDDYANNDSRPFSETVYEPSPLNRVSDQYGPGQQWKTNNRRTQTAYRSNHANEAGYYYISGTSVVRNGYYPANSLYVTQFVDEDNHQSFEFKDKQGRVVLQRQENEGNNDTYFVYDDQGNLCFVLPPLAAEATTGNGTYWYGHADLTKYVYFYGYDHRNRCTEKILPGGSRTIMIYDKADRLVMMRDFSLSQKGKWGFYVYDPLGRMVLQGERSFVRISEADLANYYANSLSTASYTGSGLYGYGAVTAYGQNVAESEITQANYYDNDSWRNLLPQSDSIAGKTVSGYGAPFASQHGRLSGTISLTLGSAVPSKIATSYYYDFKGNIQQSHASNYMGGYDHHYFSYSHDNLVDRKLTVHRASGPAITEEYTYRYDHAGRPVGKYHSLNGSPKQLEAEYTYNELGQLKTKNTAGLETSAYTYNVRGWLRETGGNKFSQKLYYESGLPAGTPCFNGNISGLEYKTGAATAFDKYTFTYDHLGRMTDAVHSLPGGGYSESARYDRHGNMTTLKRYGLMQTGGYGLTDDLTFNLYGNRLTSVSESAPNQNLNSLVEYKKAAGNTYTYDGTGRLTSDLSKNISQIEYNSLHLPQRIVQGSNFINYVYDASGVKHEVMYAQGSEMPLRFNYTDNKVYKNGQLKMILTEDGYIELDFTTLGDVVRRYYYLKDHLGNNRVVLDQTGNVVQQTDYYPFGTNTAESTNLQEQPYKYNGKEFDHQYGLNLYDYGARHYDPVIGRFTTMDPLAEKYYSISPYAYCGNNPVNRIDPTGMDWYQNQTTGELYYNKDLTDKTTTYNDQEHVRVGGNNMMGKMGKTTEKSYTYDESVSIAEKNNYQIAPAQALVHEKTWEQLHTTGEHSVTITTGNRIEVNEKYTIVPADYQKKIQNSETLDKNIGLDVLKTSVLIVTGGKGNENVVRENYTYQAPHKMSTFEKIVSSWLNIGSAVMMGKHDYVNTVTYNTWNNYSKATNGKGPLLKWK